MEPGPRILAPKHGHSKTFVVAFWMGPVGPVDFHGMRHACQEQKVPRFQGAMGSLGSKEPTIESCRNHDSLK